MIINQFLKTKDFSILLLFIPNILRWMPYRTFSLTFYLGEFPFFWPSLFYLLYLIISPKNYNKFHLKSIKRVIIYGFLICPIILMLIENGNYAMSLWIQDLIFYILTFTLFFNPPSIEQLKFAKPLVYGLYLYILIQMIVSSLGLYQFDDSDTLQDGMMFIRAGTKAGDSNHTSIILFLFTALITSYYSHKTKLNIVIILLTIVATAMGSVRGGLIACTLYFIVYIFLLLKGKSLNKKTGIVILTSIIVYLIIQLNIFADVLFRQQELKALGNLSSSRIDLIQTALSKSMEDSPFFGVGHGRVYPPTDEVSRLKEEKGIIYSKYTGAPHNVWVLIMCEYGIIGLLALVYIFLCLIRKMNFSLLGTWGVLIVFLVLFNTEAILIRDQSLLLIYLLIFATLHSSSYIKPYQTSKNY